MLALEITAHLLATVFGAESECAASVGGALCVLTRSAGRERGSGRAKKI